MKLCHRIRYTGVFIRFILIVLLLLTALVVPATATPVTWYLSGVTLLGSPPSVTGDFVYDATSNSFSDWLITVSLGGAATPASPFTFNPVDSVSFTSTFPTSAVSFDSGTDPNYRGPFLQEGVHPA